MKGTGSGPISVGGLPQENVEYMKCSMSCSEQTSGTLEIFSSAIF